LDKLPCRFSYLCWNLTDAAIAVDIARVVAVKTALLIETHLEHECDAPNSHGSRPQLVRNEIRLRGDEILMELAKQRTPSAKS